MYGWNGWHACKKNNNKNEEQKVLILSFKWKEDDVIYLNCGTHLFLSFLSLLWHKVGNNKNNVNADTNTWSS